MDRRRNMEKSQVKERGKTKKMESARSERIKQRRKEEYNAKNKEVKRSAREDNRTWMENKALAADKVAESGRNKELYSTMKTIAGERKRQPTGQTRSAEERNTRKSTEMG